MALLDLHMLGSPVLREKSAPVEEIDDGVRQLVDDLYETMYAARGIGLAANQIGGRGDWAGWGRWVTSWYW